MTTYSANETAQVKAYSLGDCYPAGTDYQIDIVLHATMVAVGQSKTWDIWVLDEPYAGSVAGAIASGTTSALINGGDNTSGGSWGAQLLNLSVSLSQTADAIYIVAQPNVTTQPWYSDGGTVISVDSGPSESPVDCPPGEDDRPVVSPLPPLPPHDPTPPGALLEIYTTDPDSDRWGAADWSDGDPAYLAHWGGGGWQDITHLAVECVIRWGATDLDPGILSDQIAADWRVNAYDPDRHLDPANSASPYAPDLIPGLPIRLSQRGVVVRRGRAEEISYRHAEGTAAIRASDAIATLARATVPDGAISETTMKAIAAEAVLAAGAPVELVPGTGDYAVPAYPDAGETDAWWWIRQTARDRHVIPYVDNHDRIRWRAYSVPLRRGVVVTGAELVDLVATIAEGNRVSRVRVVDETGTPEYELAASPLPPYGYRTHVRDLPTTDAEDWAFAVLDDRQQASIRYRPGEVRAWTAALVDLFATIEPNEEIILDVDGITDPIQAQILGGRIRVAWETATEPVWRFWWVMTAGQSIVLVSDQDGTPLVSDDDEDTYLEAD